MPAEPTGASFATAGLSEEEIDDLKDAFATFDKDCVRTLPARANGVDSLA